MLRSQTNKSIGNWKACIVVFICSFNLACTHYQQSNIEQTTLADSQNTFFDEVMQRQAYLPSNQQNTKLACNLTPRRGIQHEFSSSLVYKSSAEVDYSERGWESRISHNPTFFSAPRQAGKILVIDFAQGSDKLHSLGYAYLSNDNTYTDVYEPWSSSKVFAFTGAVAKLRENGLAAQAKVGNTFVADMITGIHTYQNFGTSPGDSNALATFLANLAGREYLTALFYDEWLKLSQDNIYFRGAYGPDAFTPDKYEWNTLKGGEAKNIFTYLKAEDDPAYLSYRCAQCGLTGNKPMTTLAQAEWLKRLAAHDRDTQTRHPKLTSEDVQTLFYGKGHSFNDERFAGMTLGISSMLHRALANAMAKTDIDDPKHYLDKATKGEWRIFQKIGWGPSETRSTTEIVVLAHVCLPYFQGGREFTLAAQVAVPEAKEDNLAIAGKKMQSLLETSFTQLLTVEPL